MRLFLLAVLLTFLGTERVLGFMDPDSLNREFAKMPVDSASLEYATALSVSCQNESYQIKQVIYSWIVIYARKTKEYEREGKAIHMLGRLLMDARDYDSAARFFTAALKLAEKHKLYDVASRVYSSYGHMYYQFNQFNDAIKNYEKAIYYA